MSKALVTGGLGFLGYHLSVRLLAAGFEVHALDNGRRGSIDDAVERLCADRRYRLTLGDVSDPQTFGGLDDGYTHVFHMAAIVGVSNVAAEPFRVLVDNTTTLLRVLSWARGQSALQRLVFPSTSEVYAGTLEAFSMPIPTPEDTPLAVADMDRPRTSYMLSKIYGEALCGFSGLPCTIIRPHNIYGPRMGSAHVIPELLERAHRTPEGGTLTVYSPSHTRTFCYVDDAVELVVRLATSPDGAGRTFNVGSTDHETPIARLGELVARTVGKRLTLAFGPDTEGSPARRVPDVGAAVSVARFMPEIPLADGLRRTYAWYRAHAFGSAAAA